jgi:hypothetical protein
VARLTADYLLRSLKMIGELAQGELLTGLVNLALVQANVATWTPPAAPSTAWTAYRPTRCADR